MNSNQPDATRRRVHDDAVEDIRRQITDGTLPPDSYLLPERELAKKYRISSRAVREGLAKLEAEGLLLRQQGRGTIVRAPELKTADKQSQKQKNVAVIFQGRVRDSSTAEDFDSLQQAFQRDGYGTTLYVADGNPDKETQIVEQLAADGVPGLVLFSAHASSSDAHLRAAIKAGMKVVVYDHDFPECDCNFVGIDDVWAAREATEHLIRLGCQELVYINSARDWTTHVLRQQGFEEAANGRDHLPHHVLRIPNCTSHAELVATMKQQLSPILDKAQRPLGILCWWDEIALRTMKILRDSGWSVPDDAKVVGIANEQSGELADVPLTTVEIPREQIALLAATSLVSQMRDPNRQPIRIRLKGRLIIRESCGNYRHRLDQETNPSTVARRLRSAATTTKNAPGK